MEPKDFDKKKLICSIDFVPEEVQIKLKQFNIHTIGQLLSSTKGLTNANLLFASPEEQEVLEKLQESVPEEIRKEYESFSAVYPTGLITNKNEENEKNNSDNTK